MQDHVFPPELVMQHQAEIQLTEDQRTRIMTSIQAAQSEMTDLSWKMVVARDAVFAAMDADPVDGDVVRERADALFALENNVKHEQLELLVAIKNTLNPAQRTRLRELQKALP